jgi:hypothetical protein
MDISITFLSTTNNDEIKVNGDIYIKKSLVDTKRYMIYSKASKKKYVIIRAHEAGIHFGILKSREGREIVLTNARRVWYWEGAATISQLAVDGTLYPEKCKFPVPVPEITILNVIEIIPMTDKAISSLNNVPVWEAQ